jgi:hypothetical protein
MSTADPRIGLNLPKPKKRREVGRLFFAWIVFFGSCFIFPFFWRPLVSTEHPGIPALPVLPACGGASWCFVLWQQRSSAG